MANKPDHHLHHNHHQSSRRLMLVLYFTSVLGVGIVAAFLCLSSFNISFPSVSSIWVPPEIQTPNIDSRIVQKVHFNRLCVVLLKRWISLLDSPFLLTFREANNRTIQKSISDSYRQHSPICRRRNYNGSKCRQLRFLDLTDTPYKSKTFCTSSPVTAVSTM